MLKPASICYGFRDYTTHDAKGRSMRLFIGIFFAALLSFPTLASEEKHSESDLLDRPLMERYFLDELKPLREDQQDLDR